MARTMPPLKPSEITRISRAVNFRAATGYDDFDGHLKTFTTPMIVAYHLLVHPRFDGDPDECSDCVDECR